MRVSRDGLGFIASFEGLFTYAYPDPGTGGEPWTIGIGHTRAAGRPHPRPGMTITLKKAVQLFEDVIRAKYAPQVERAVRRPMTQLEFDALVSFHYNTGAIRSGSVDDRLNRGDVLGALATWGRYIRAGGRVMRGLVRRRNAEIAIWRTGRYPRAVVSVRHSPHGQAHNMAADRLPWGSAGQKSPLTADFPPIEAVPPIPARKPNQLLELIFAIIAKLKGMMK